MCRLLALDREAGLRRRKRDGAGNGTYEGEGGASLEALREGWDFEAKKAAGRPADARELVSELQACIFEPAWTDDLAKQWWGENLPGAGERLSVIGEPGVGNQ